jgi:hypothetical protein
MPYNFVDKRKENMYAFLDSKDFEFVHDEDYEHTLRRDVM